jgi:membrane associated rhomboid family serine protease
VPQNLEVTKIERVDLRKSVETLLKWKAGRRMFIPVYSDAAKYFWPIGTGIIVLLNVVVFICQLSFELDAYKLEYGSGLHPVQWLTSIFMHGSLMHLIGNLLFLWAFGLVIEGRVGTLYFLALYLGMGIA